MQKLSFLFKSLLIVFVCGPIIQKASAADDTLVAEIRFGTEQPDLNTIAETTYKVGNSEVRFSFNGINTSTVIENECFGADKLYYGLSFDKKASDPEEAYPNGTAPGVNQSWMFIENLGSSPITRIVFNGVSEMASSDLLCDFILKGGQRAIDLENGFVGFAYPSTVCQNIVVDLTAYDQIEGWDDFDRYTYDDLQTIRFTSTRSTGDTGSGKPFIQSISVYTEGGQFTGDPSLKASGKFNCYVSRERLFFTEEASSVYVYNVSGTLAGAATNVKEYELNALPGGVYIVKGTNASGEKMIKKIVR